MASKRKTMVQTMESNPGSAKVHPFVGGLRYISNIGVGQNLLLTILVG